MIIVFFHVLYLLGKFIYRNYQEDDGDADVEEKIIGVVEEKICCIDEKNKVDESDIYPNFYDEEESSNIKFNPPAYLQRYQAVAEVLADEKYEGQIRKIVDFGCSEFGFFQHMKNTRGIEEILCVDVDKNVLQENSRKIEPLTSDYLACRSIPLVVHVLEGSVTDNDQYLENSDAVVCIELIEHLYPETCLNLPFNIFGFIQPKIAVFTTPNADFNVLFKRMTGFRHWDHKFEWTREQFQDWANNIITRYPNYYVQFMGICAGPPGSEALGHCSQMAIFHRKYVKTPLPIGKSLFNVIKSVEYPYRIDNRSIQEKTLEEAVYYIRNYSFNNDDESSMPLELLAKWIDTVSIPILKEILIKDGWNIIDHKEKGLSVLCPPLSEYSESNDIYDDDDDDDNYNEKWNEQSAPPAYQSQDWPEIRDQDEEIWDNDLDYSSISHQSGIDCDLNDIHSELVGNSIVTNGEIPGTSKGYNGHCEYGDKNNHSQRITLRLDEKSKLPNENDKHHDSMTLHSICSMYLQSSTCENDQTCPENITNPDFQLSQILNNDNIDKQSQSLSHEFSTRIQRNLSSEHDDKHINSPNSTSTPMKKNNKKDIFQPKLNEKESLNCEISSDNCSSCQKEKYEVMKKLKENSLLTNLGNDGISKKKTKSLSSGDDHNTIFHYNDKSSLVNLENSSQEFKSLNSSQYNVESISLSPSKSDQFHSLHSVEEEKKNPDIKANRMENYELNESKEILNVIETFGKESDDKALSEARESPPNSWSPEIMDSGYPNTSSAHDITPEYDLSSIGQDRISESESPSLAEPPRQLEEEFENFAVENGDLVNNNRDGEGNNVIPIEERNLEDFGPLINVLENDLENENDIYDLENGFPIWLLRILDAGALEIIERAVGIRDDKRDEVDENENENVDEDV